MVELSEGVKLRTQIDTEVVKGLLLANGGGAVALLTFLSTVFSNEKLNPLALYIVFALGLFLLGITAAITHNHLRRRCSLIHEAHNMRPPPGKFLGRKLRKPTACSLSSWCMWGSIVFFMLGGVVVFAGAVRLL
jgi:hypothetical protein